jgi:hypothetical protein
MNPQSTDKPAPEIAHEQAAEHVAGAHHLLKALREKLSVEKHPELEEAIQRLEMALSVLTVKTGGML